MMRRYLLSIIIVFLWTGSLYSEDQKLRGVPTSLADRIELALINNPDIALAEAELKKAEAELKRVRIDVVTRVTKLHNQLAAAEDHLAALEQMLKRREVLYRAGTAGGAELQKARADLIEGRVQKQIHESDLKQLLGLYSTGRSLKQGMMGSTPTAPISGGNKAKKGASTPAGRSKMKTKTSRRAAPTSGSKKATSTSATELRAPISGSLKKTITTPAVKSKAKSTTPGSESKSASKSTGVAAPGSVQKANASTPAANNIAAKTTAPQYLPYCIRSALEANEEIQAEKAKGPIESNFKVMKLVFEVYKAYWDCYFRLKDLKAKKESLELLEDNFRGSVRTGVMMGSMPPIALDEIELSIAEGRVGVITAESDFEDAAERLCTLIGMSDLSEWKEFVKTLLPSAELRTKQKAPDLDKCIEEAFANRLKGLAYAEERDNAPKGRTKRFRGRIAAEVARAIRHLRTSIETVKLTRKTREIRGKLLVAEQRRFAVGNAPLGDLLQSERDLAKANSNEAKAYADYATSLAELELAKGTIVKGTRKR